MSKKTYNPITGQYDFMSNRYDNHVKYWEPQYKEVPNNYVELPNDLSEEEKHDISLHNDYYNTVQFEKNKSNYDLIAKSGYLDVIGLTAYQYNHILESQKKYLDLADKYGAANIMNKFNLSSEDLKHWNEDVEKPNLLQGLSDVEIKELADNYLLNATNHYNEVVKPAQEAFKSKQESLLKDNTFLYGISHFSDLPTEKQEDIKTQLKQRGIIYNNDEDYNKVFTNTTFKKIFGENLFKKTSYADRERMVKDYSISSLLEERFKDDPLLLRIQNLDHQEKIDLYNNSLFLNYDEALKEEDKGSKKIDDTAELYGNWAEDGGISGGLIYESIAKKLENTKTIANKKTKDLGVSALEKREVLLEEYERKSNQRKVELVKPDIEYNKKVYNKNVDSGAISVVDIEKEFDETFSEILPHYWVFKDKWELKDFTIQDKIDYLSTYKSLVQEDPITAMQVVNDMMKEYIDDEQGFFAHGWYGLKNAGVGFIAELMNMYIGVKALTKAISGPEAYAEYMNSGEVNYWHDVSNYNTFDKRYHKLADFYGGVSPFKGVAAPGEEYNILDLRTLEEALSMGKYVMSIMAATATGAGIANFTGRKILGLTGNALTTFMNTANTLTRGFAASGMAQSMAKGTFDETYQKLQQQVNDKINFELNELGKNPVIQTQVINEWLNSDLINSKLEETLKQAEKEWEKQNKKAAEKGTSLSIDKNQYLNNVRTEFLNNVYKDASNNVDSLIKNKYSEEVTNKHSLYSQEEILEASARAAMIQASMSWVKEFAAGFLWNKWMIHKNARLNIKSNPMEGLRATETGVETIKKAMTTSDYLKPLITRPIKEFGDEWLDVHTEHFSQGFGLQNFNNLTAQMYDPYSYLKSINIPYNMWRPTTGIGAGIKSVADGFFDKAGIYEGLIGAVSAFGGSANVVGLAELLTEEGRDQASLDWNTKSKLYNINKFISNSIISDIVEEQENIMQKEGLANVINEVIKKNGHILQDVHALLQANAVEERAYAERDEEAIRNSGVRVAFQLAMTLRDETLSALPQIQQKVKDLERFAKGEITQEDIELHRKQLQLEESEVISDEEVIADLKNNSKKLLDVITKTNESFNVIEKSKYGKSLSQQTKAQLVYNRVYSSVIEEELNNLETQITGKDHYVDIRGELNTEFSSEKGLNEYIKVQSTTIKLLRERKKTIEKRLALEKKGRKKKRDYYIQSLELDLKNLNKELDLQNEEYDRLERVILDESIALSENEILSLNPEDRAQMLNPLFKERYNKKQQKIIETLIERLRRENPSILDNIYLSGQLYTNKRLNDKAYNNILENVDIHNNYVKYMQQSFNNRAAKAGLNIIKDEVAEDLNNVEDSELMRHLMQKPYSAELIEAYRRENVVWGTERDTILIEAENIFKTLKAIGTVINSNEDDSTKQSLKNLFSLVIEKIPITNSKEFLQNLINFFNDVEGDLGEKAREVLQKVAKLTNQINTTSENNQVDRDQRKQENNNRVDEEQRQQRDAESIQPKVNPESKPETQQPETSNEESPTIQKQAKQAGAPVNTVQKDTTEEGNVINTTNNYVSIYSGFEVKPLNEDGILVPKRGAEENDRMSVFYKFLENKGIKLQDIIDFELHKILQKNPNTKVYFAMHSTNDSNFNNYMFAVVEYTDDVRSVHNESRGGTFTTLDGKKYLIIGAVGTDSSVEGGRQSFIDLQHRLVRQRNSYISNHSENDYFWVSNDYTQIKDIQTGRRVRSTQNSEVKMRSISELLYNEDGNFNEESNPNHLGDPKNKRRGYSSLGWTIQKGDEYITINTGSKKVIPLNSPSDNNGAVFVLIETADGSLLPIYINPAFYNEIKDGTLKDKINSALMDLLSKDFERRKKAKEELKQFLVLSDDNTFTIGKEGFNSISIKRNGSVFKTFNIDEGVNVSEFLDAVKQANFRINVTISTLQTPGLIAEYDEAGALTTDVSVLHTRNASFTMYHIDNEGKPIIDDTPSYQPTSKPKEGRQIQFGNKRYREENGVFKDELDKVITDSELIKKLKFAQQVEKMEPSLQERGFNYYVIDDNKENPIVIRVGTSKEVVIANKEQGLFIIDRINQIAEKKAKAEAAKKEMDEMLSQLEQFDLTSDNVGEVNNPTITETSQTAVTETVIPTQQTSSVNTQKDVNKAGNISLENLEGSNNLTTFADIYEDIESSIELEEIFTSKGWIFGTQQEVEKFLESKKVPLVGITNVESWLDLIKNCR